MASQYGGHSESPFQSLKQGSYDEHALTLDPMTRRSEDYMSQMGEKIRQQAGALQELESYKALCEKRILEFCPDHPIPVLPEHLGKCIPD